MFMDLERAVWEEGHIRVKLHTMFVLLDYLTVYTDACLSPRIETEPYRSTTYSTLFVLDVQKQVLLFRLIKKLELFIYDELICTYCRLGKILKWPSQSLN